MPPGVYPRFVGQSPRTPAIERILRRLPPEATGWACWIWPGGKIRGYGQIGAPPPNELGAKRSLRTHRVTYEHFRGPIPDGLELDHLCRTPACCNPFHLEAVTPTENWRRSNFNSAVNARLTSCPRCGGDFRTVPRNRKGGELRLRRYCPTCAARWSKERREAAKVRR